MLDVDGVLNIQSKSYTTSKHHSNLCERHLTQRLNYLCSKIENIEIVISSSWRRDMIALEETLKEAGFLYWEKVVGRTSISALSDSQKRGEQIHSWLKKNISETFLPRIDANLFIIDDEPYGIQEFWEHHSFFTDCTVGITDELVLKIISRATNGI